MKLRRTMHLSLIVMTAMSLSREAPVSGQSAGSSPRDPGVAVVELFTSEGCSSCPPAEAVLAGLTRDAERAGRPVFTLAFHVDYWNHLGWADRFSDLAYSQRQEQYSQALHREQIYTPQMVVNGKVEFVGSDRKAAAGAIAEALAAPAPVSIKVAVDGNPRDGSRVHVALTGAEAGTVVNVAVVEQGLSTEVKSGENAGHRLEEPSVVRWFKTVPAADAREVAIPSLPQVRAGSASVIVYAQRPANGAILGAAAAMLK
jgi:hypothetical protein